MQRFEDIRGRILQLKKAVAICFAQLLRLSNYEPLGLNHDLHRNGVFAGLGGKKRETEHGVHIGTDNTDVNLLSRRDRRPLPETPSRQTTELQIYPKRHAVRNRNLKTMN